MKPILPFLLLFFAALSSRSVFSACEKEPETITKTIIERDTIVIMSVDTVYLTETDTVTLSSFIHDTATTFICLRHAETTGVGTDPVLSSIGLARAETLKRIMGNVALQAVYATDYNRTRQTATPTATDKGLSVLLYNPANLNGLADGILSSHHGGAVLVLGHSNTTPSLLNVLVGQNLYANLPETEYDNLFVVTVFEKGRANVLHLKYGE